MQLVATGTKPVTRIELKQESLLVATSFHAILHIGYITGNFKRLKCVSKLQVTNSLKFLAARLLIFLVISLQNVN